MHVLELIDRLFDAVPLAALFVTVALGHFVGKFQVGRFVLGGIAGTLLVGVVIGQLGIKIDPSVRSIFFALFIYAIGYQGGPQLVHALNWRSLNQLLSAVVMCVLGLLAVLAVAWLFDLDRGLAAGLGAGGMTQSAMLGTATSAITELDVPHELIRKLEVQAAVGFTVCYFFGALTPIILVTWFLPMVMKWDIRTEALKLAKEMSGGKPELEPGQFDAMRMVVTRVYRVLPGATAVGKSCAGITREFPAVAVETVVRGGEVLEAAEDMTIEAGDLVMLIGKVAALGEAASAFGPETVAPEGIQVIEENRRIILTNRDLAHRPLRSLGDNVGADAWRGNFLVAVKRMGRDLPLLPRLELKRGDELIFTGLPSALDRLQAKVGYRITPAAVTDFIFFGIGMAVGIFIGMIDVEVDGIPLTVGTGGGCLVSGLFFGWLRSVRPRFAALPTGASNFLRDFGLTVFVGVVGVTAGPAAIVTIENHGLMLFVLGVGVTLVPSLIGFYVSYYLLKIRNPIEALACLVGGRSANPAFVALLDKAGNATPVASFTVTYAVSNVLLALWGPLIVGIITKNPSP